MKKCAPLDPLRIHQAISASLSFAKIFFMDFNIPKECMRHIYMYQWINATFWNKKLCTTIRCKIQANRTQPRHANQDSRIVMTKCHRQVRKKGSSPDPAASVLLGVWQA
jgi:hypothetical protein